MACILKTGKTFSDKRDKMATITSPYMIVDVMGGNAKRPRVNVFIYSRPTNKTERWKNVVQEVVAFEHKVETLSDYQTYFSPNAVSGNGDQVELAYDWILQLPELDPDTNQPTGNLIYGDTWESDE